MKKHIIKILEQPKKVISITLVIAVCFGIVAYIYVGKPPHITTIQLESDTRLATQVSSGSFSDGQEVNLAFPKAGRISAVYVKSGENVRKGQILASLTTVDAQGVVSQAQAALTVAKANYEKILNGATGSDIEVLKSAVAKANTVLTQSTRAQDILVKNAYTNLLNSTPEAVPVGDVTNYVAPTISGNYSLGKEGTIFIKIYNGGGNGTFSFSGLSSGSGTVSTVPTMLGDSGLYISFPSNATLSITEWMIVLPNKKAATYLSNYNAYQNALATQSQVIASATADLNQAQTTLAAKQAQARPEDVAIARAQVESAEGALEIAQGAYSNNVITAPEDGLITVVNIHPGEIAAINQKAIGMIIRVTK